MSFQSAAVFLSVLSLVSCSPATSVGQKGIRIHETAKNSLLPKHWATSHVLSSKSGGTPNGYIIAGEYFESNTCSSNHSLFYATGTGVCLVGIDTNGKVVGSSILTFTGVTNTYITYNSTIYSTSDCTSTPTSNTVEYAPQSCFPASSTVGIKYTYTTDITPWTSYDTGFVFK